MSTLSEPAFTHDPDLASRALGGSVVFANDEFFAERENLIKPAPAVYGMVGDRFGTARGEVLFVSSNGWDAASAAGYGFETVWANRAGLPVERLPWRPRHILPDLSRIPELLP